MTNSVVVNVIFYFKGEKFTPSASIDLDMYFQAKKDINYIYDMLGKSIGIDEYRHEYDVMVMEDIMYSEPEGIAKDYVQDGKMDWSGLEKAYQAHNQNKTLKDLALSHFSAEELEANPKLMQALAQAYKMK